jgi:hypothetical protein
MGEWGNGGEVDVTAGFEIPHTADIFHAGPSASRSIRHPMTQPEYLTVLVSIIVGLGVTDLAKSIRDLLHPDRPVRWHWLPLTWAAVAILMVVSAWWAFFEILQGAVWGSPVAFLLILVATLNLYFLCAFALPDLDGPPQSKDPDRVNLKSFYFSGSHRRAFFGVAIAFLVSFFSITEIWQITSTERTPTEGMLNATVNSLIFAFPYGPLIFTDRTWVHVLITIVGVGGALFLLLEMAPFMAGE